MKKKVKLKIRENEAFNNGMIRLFHSLHEESARLVLLRSHQHISVHELRKNIKKIRGALRLVKHEIGEKSYKELNAYYRNIAAEVAVLRDDTSQIELLQGMQETVKSPQIQKSINKAIYQVRKKRQREFALFYEAKKEEAVNYLIKNKIGYYKELAINGNPENFIMKSLRSIYRDARKALKATEKIGNKDTYHDLRKQVKYLMYHLMILSNSLSEDDRKYVDDLDLLSDYLGNLHDLDLFHEHIKDGKLIKLDKKNKQSVQKYIYRRRTYLKKRIHSVGDVLFKDNSKVFAQRIYEAWNEKAQIDEMKGTSSS